MPSEKSCFRLLLLKSRMSSRRACPARLGHRRLRVRAGRAAVYNGSSRVRKWLQPCTKMASAMYEIAPELAVVPMLIANAYLAGNARSWVLVDSGVPGSHRPIRRAAAKRFGPGARPQAIVLTHGHRDHAGSAGVLADEWGVPVYVH